MNKEVRYLYTKAKIKLLLLVELVGLVRYYMQIKGNYDLTVVSTGVTVPTTLREIGWPKASCDKASFSLF